MSVCVPHFIIGKMLLKIKGKDHLKGKEDKPKRKKIKRKQKGDFLNESGNTTW